MQRLIDKEWKKGLVIFAGLVIFHLAVSVSLSLIARSTFLAGLHNGKGLWNLAPDSFSYHREAIRLLDFLEKGNLSGWWESSPFWHVKWIALSYGIIAPDPLSFAPINAFAWAASVIFVYKIVRHLLPDRQTLAAVSALVFGLWLSYLFHTTQLLKDLYFILGILMMVLGWICLLSGRRGIGSSFLVGCGVLLAYLNRSYILEPLIFLSLLAAVLVFWRARSSWVYGLLALVLLGGFSFYEYHGKVKPSSRAETKASLSVQHPGTKASRQVETNVPGTNIFIRLSHRLSAWLKHRVRSIAGAREIWISKYPEAGSNTGTDVHFRSLKEIAAYIPRAALIGFLAPFPSHWFGTPRTAGPASRILAGLEMMVWYILLPGFVYFLFSGTVAPHIRIWMLVYTLTLVVLTSLVVTNIGALYRLRYVYFLPILIGGLEGWARFYVQRFQKTTS